MLQKRTQYLLLLFFALAPWTIRGQCIPNYVQALDGNQVNADISNSADHFWDFNGTPKYEVPKGSGVHSIFASSMWIGGLDLNEQLHLAANTYRQLGTDFFAGPYRRNQQYDCGRTFEAAGVVFDRGLLALSGGKVAAFFSGGFTVYNPATQTKADYTLPSPRNQYRVKELPDGRILLYGDDSYPTISSPMIIDTATFTATSIASLQYFHRNSSATRLLNGQILIAGLLGCEIFDPVSGTSTAVASMNRMRSKHAAVLLPNGNVLVVGGGAQLGGNGATPTTEIYNPAADTWTNGPSMNVARNAPEITQLPNGNYLITGGTVSFVDFTIYDPIANTMSAAAGPTFPFNEHSAIPMSNGDVLIATKHTNYELQIFRYNATTQSISLVNFANAEMLATRMTSGNIMLQFRDGSFFEMSPDLEFMVDNRWQNSWKVSSSQVSQFIVDYNNNQVNFANYPDIETWPAHGDTSLGEDRHLAPFVDVNMDGNYRPLQDGDYPCIEGDQAIWTVFNDDATHTETMGQVMGIQVERMAYSYDCNSTQCPDPNLDYSTFYHYEITNKSENDYKDVYIGIWTDYDMGGFSDDYIGCDSTLSLGFVYNGDNNDEGIGGFGGYGIAPPAMGTVFLDNGDISGMTNFMYYQNDFTGQGNPVGAAEYYNLMRSIFKDGSPLVNNGINGYSGTAPGPRTNFIYPGDPGFCGGQGTGWSEVSAANIPFDRRGLQTVGPLNLAAGEKLEFDVALIWARGSDNLSSVCNLKASTATIKSWWENQSHSCFNIVLAETPQLSENAVTLFPNPTRGTFRVNLGQSLMEEGTLALYDLSGRKVYQQEIPAQQRSLAVAPNDLPEGMYLVRIAADQQTITKKLVVRH